jgi:hypothetical protein
MEQIAGDELFPGDHKALVATGFLRAGPRHVVGGNTDQEVNRQEVLLEMTLGVSNAFMGLTVGCARCHNHKFDPITQADHFRLQAIMAATDLKEIEFASKEEKERAEAAKKAHEARLKPLQDEIAAIEKPYREQLREAKKQMLAPALRAALDIPKEKRTPEQEALAKDAGKQIGLSWDEVVNALPPDVKARRAAIRARIHQINLDEPEPAPAAFAVANMDTAPVTHILKIGDPKFKLDPVEPAFLSVLGGLDAPKGSNGRRAALAKWLADPENPLTARVMANRIWQFRMGSGIVSTPNDFGQLGGRPSNRPLLDWLAAEFVSSGWNVRHLDRLIVTSATYRQSAQIDEAKAAIDGGNKYYWRMNQRRLEGEALRDSILQASGKLNAKAFGPPIKTPIEPEIYDIIFTEAEPDNLWPLPKDRAETYRKSDLPVEQADRPPADADQLRSAGRHQLLPRPRRQHPRAAGADAAEQRLHARAVAGAGRSCRLRLRSRWARLPDPRRLLPHAPTRAQRPRTRNGPAVPHAEGDAARRLLQGPAESP